MRQTCKFLALAFVMGAPALLFAQDAKETTINYNKAPRSAVTATYDQPAPVIEAALRKRLAQEGLRRLKSSGGYMICNGAVWQPVSTEKMDIYFKVTGNKNKSTITVLASRGYDNFVSTANDPVTVSQIKRYLNGFTTHASSYSQGLDIKTQEEAIRRAEKAYNNTVEQSKLLLAQKERLERKIAENNTEQLLKQKALHEEQQKMTALQIGR